ncbi:MAG: protein kinase [Polyangiaceae bacterium]|nr:protein kinase [Polyangiaceae bacterium]
MAEREPKSTDGGEVYGRYRLLSPLGRGGMAEVWKAKSFGAHGFEKTLVIKRILPALAARQQFVDRFVHEAKLAVRLSHANVVQVFDLGRVDGDPPSYFIAMEHVAGLDLSTVAARARAAGEPLSDDLALLVTAEIAKGRDHAHRRRDEDGVPLGVVHRDVSPQNVLLSWDGEVKVTDFGIAKARHIDERAGDAGARVVKGKYAYMSPEQARGEEVDARSDVFSLGVVLYELLTGSNPYRAQEAEETLRRAQRCEVPPLEALRPELPRALTALVARMLRPHPGERTPDAGRVVEDILAYQYDAGVRASQAELATRVSALVASPSPSRADAPPEHRTSVEIPASPASVKLAETSPGSPSAPPVSALSRREVTAAVFALRAPDPVAERAVVDAVERWGGVLVGGHGGHRLEALFGLSEDGGRDTEHAARAALVIARSSTVPLLGVGLHAGRVNVSAAGAPLLDDAAAAVIAQAAELAGVLPGRVVASRAAARLIEPLFVMDAASKEASRAAFAITREQRGEAPQGRFFGRRDELATLGRALADSARKRLSILTVRGPAGAGKSRFLREAQRRLQKGGYDVFVLVAACPPGGDAAPFSGIGALVRTLLGAHEGASVDRSSDLRAYGLVDAEVAALLSTTGAGGGESSASAVHRATLRLLSRLSNERPHLVAFDDARSLDEASRDALEAAALRLPHARLALLFSGRIERCPLAVPGVIDLPLGPLPRADAASLLADRLGVQTVPDVVARFVDERAEDNPLFIEQLARELLESGAVSVVERAVVEARLDALSALPRALRTVLAARLGRLDAEELRVLSLVALAGAPLDDAVLEAAVGEHGPVVAARLVEAGLLRDAGGLTPASVALAEALSDGAVSPEVARGHHAALADALVGDPALGARTRRAQHLCSARRAGEAAEVWLTVAREHLRDARFDAATSAALSALRAALSDEPDKEALAEALSVLAGAAIRSRVARGAEELAPRALAALRGGVPASRLATAALDGAAALAATSSFDGALALLDEARALTSPDDPRPPLLLAELSARRGDFRQALAALEHPALAASPEHAPRRALLAAQAHGALGDHARALRLLDEAEASDPTVALDAWKLRGLVYFFGRRFEDAAAASERAVSLAREVGAAYEVAINLHNVGDARLRLGDRAHAYAAFRQSLAAAEQSGSERLAEHDRAFLGYLDALQDIPGGEAQVRAAIAYAEARGYAWDVVNARYLLGLLLLHLGLVSAASVELSLAREQSRAIGNRTLEEDCQQALGHLTVA